ncbi:hypothetical protein SPHINGO8BC_51752 [Sphingobacterium multivorum]|uniref:Uncharacterized protein n=1 Tax=Sphingobacterium multivorum TaxID=28454 RepID=A0A654D8N1_SPHMU|nr:hypothetical protein SPHINGO8BC_51752 [Sphingobacterium multivorum]
MFIFNSLYRAKIVDCYLTYKQYSLAFCFLNLKILNGSYLKQKFF